MPRHPLKQAVCVQLSIDVNKASGTAVAGVFSGIAAPWETSAHAEQSLLIEPAFVHHCAGRSAGGSFVITSTDTPLLVAGGGGGGGGSCITASATNVTRTAGKTDAYPGVGAQGANGSITFSLVSATAVPEPGSLAMLATGLLGLGALRRKRRRTPHDPSD